MPELNGTIGLSSVDFEEALDADIAVIVTAHPDVDYEAILNPVPLVVDLRGHTRKLSA